jgi:hypothetical protein
VLRGYGIQSCLVERDEPFATLLASSPDWNKVYSDQVSALYVRRGASNAAPWALVLAEGAPVTMSLDAR